uniref:LOB domain-containing protein n=1 Tax=Oryza brachyantha TaxID=4533 RepID=J3KY58_ORYBR
MTGGGSGAGACAVCKHQRRKCEPNCELAAYFPANRMNDFRALHLVFGGAAAAAAVAPQCRGPAQLSEGRVTLGTRATRGDMPTANGLWVKALVRSSASEMNFMV